MKPLQRSVLGAFWEHPIVVAIGFALLFSPSASAQGNSQWENAVNVLEMAFTARLHADFHWWPSSSPALPSLSVKAARIRSV